MNAINIQTYLDGNRAEEIEATIGQPVCRPVLAHYEFKRPLEPKPEAKRWMRPDLAAKRQRRVDMLIALAPTQEWRNITHFAKVAGISTIYLRELKLSDALLEATMERHVKNGRPRKGQG